MRTCAALLVVTLALVAAPALADNARDIVNPNEPFVSNPPSAPGTWERPLAVLYDNGPLVTSPGGGAGGVDASEVQTALGLTVYGFGHSLATGFRVADDFTVPAPGWHVNTVTFFAYQTNSGTTSTINNVNLVIWNGDPSNPASTVVFGDTTTNRLASSDWSNIYRVLDTDILSTARPPMANVVTVGIDLAPGTYWVDWQTGGTLASGPWAPPVSILGQMVTGNAQQYDPTVPAWNPLLDVDSQQDLPFIIEGDPLPVELQSFSAE
jgi:hypothetical protein